MAKAKKTEAVTEETPTVDQSKYVARIKKIERETVIESGDTHLAVTVQLVRTHDKEGVKLEKPKLVKTLRNGYPLGTSEEDLKAGVKKALDLFVAESQQYEENKKNIERNKRDDETITNLTGGVIV